MTVSKQLAELINAIPKTPEGEQRAKIIVLFLSAYQAGKAAVEEIQRGEFEKTIEDVELSRKAANLFAYVKEENSLTTTSDLTHLYFWVLNIVKLQLTSQELLKVLKEGQLADKAKLQYIQTLAKLDTNFHNLNMQYQRELAIARDKRMAKELKTIGEGGETVTQILSNIDLDSQNIKEVELP